MLKVPMFSTLRRAAGFTMIELLIVITIIGILAVAVLSAINPLEQINRGRDTASQSDAEQLINAIERFVAFQEYYPWDADVSVPATPLIAGGTANHAPLVHLGGTGSEFEVDGVLGCPLLVRLGTGDAAVSGCAGTNEVKESYITKVYANGLASRGVEGDGRGGLYVYKTDNTTGTNLYSCFIPQSQAMKRKAQERCTDAAGTGLPADLIGAASAICGCAAAGQFDAADCLLCLP